MVAKEYYATGVTWQQISILKRTPKWNAVKLRAEYVNQTLIEDQVARYWCVTENHENQGYGHGCNAVQVEQQ